MSSVHYTSGTSSRSSSASFSGDGPRVLAPKNISRLGRTQSYASSSKSTLNDPIDIPEFKTPSLPDPRPHRVPLTAPSHINMDSINADPATATAPTPSRLKRLSLLTKSPILGTDYAAQRPLMTSPLADENSSTVQAVQEGTPRSARRNEDGGGTPRRAGTGIRSSISYSPAQTPRQSTLPYGAAMEASPRRSVESSGGREIMGLFREEETEEEIKGETLTEKHAELLRAIAQKERRVNELKQEAEQAALTTLRSRWTSLISNLYPSSPASTAMQPSSSRLSSTDSSTPHRPIRSDSESRSPDPESEQPGFQALLNDVLGSAPLVDPDLLEGGRRFIGDLMRTVGAAAGGNIPDKEARRGETKPAQGGIDLSTLKGMFAWSSAPQSTTVRIRPSDSGSSIKDKRAPPAQAHHGDSITPSSSGGTGDLIDI